MRNTILKVVLANLLVAMGSVSAKALPPALFFSDIVSGPNTGNGDGLGSGAIVTIWGANLGSSQGNSTVLIGGVQTDHVYCWGNADGTYKAGTCGGPAQLYNPYQKMQAISFSIPAGAASGLNTISVTVNGATSNNLPFTIRPGRICYIGNTSKAAGVDAANNCSFSNPLQTLQFATSAGRAGNYTPTPGDIYYVMAGTDLIGNSWILYPGIGAYPPAAPIAFITYPGVKVLIQSSTADHFGGGYSGIAVWGAAPYATNVVISKFQVQATGSVIDATNVGRVIANEVSRVPNALCQGNVQAGLIGGGGDTVVALGNYIHDGGCDTSSKLEHAFYISNRTGSPIGATELGWNYLNNTGVYGGLHVYDEGVCGGWTGAFLLHDNVVINQPAEAAGYAMACGTLGYNINTPMKIYNNLFIHTGFDTALYGPGTSGGGSTGAGHTCSICISGSNLTGLISIYNNTIYDYGDIVNNNPARGEAISLDANNAQGCFAGNVDFRDNLIVDTHGFPYYIPNCPNAAPKTHSNNLYFSMVGSQPVPSWDTAPLNANPMLVNPFNGANFTTVITSSYTVVGGSYALQPGSPAMNSGANTGPTVTLDILGTIRSQAGAAYDIGAYEYSSGVMTVTAPPAAPRGFVLK